MKLVDTCVWIEALADTPTGRAYQPLLAVPQNLLVSTLVIYELRKWLARTLAPEAADQVMVVLLTAKVVAPDESIALHAAELSLTHQLHAMDALIYATALSENAELVTCDAHFKGLPQVDYVAKLK
jgi:predicted nucleic acid-binding protein